MHFVLHIIDLYIRAKRMISYINKINQTAKGIPPTVFLTSDHEDWHFSAMIDQSYYRANYA